MITGFRATAAGFDADESHTFIFDEGIEHTGSVAATADAGDNGIGKFAERFEALLASFTTDDRLKIANHHGEGMRSDDGADDVVRVFNAAHPIAHRFVDGVAESFGAAGNRSHFSAEETHTEDVGLLTTDIFGAHVDDTREAEVSTGGGGGDTMLAGAGFGDDPFFAHAEGEEGLSDGVIDFVGAGVIDVFAFEPDLGAADVGGESFGEVEG